ncbi:MAG: glycosyltransferase family 4 protein [Marinilabiliaceae bacterium]|nr:glycosyltransferase family 4 protein [Marinilabiliaceae bacterium]
MRILLLSQYFRPEMGAPQNRLFEMLGGFKQEGVDIAVVTAMPNYPEGRVFDKYRGKFTILENLDGMLVKRFWLYASNSKRALPRIISMLSFSFTALFSFVFCRRFKPDILIVESPPLTLALTGCLLAFMCNCKLVTNVADLWPLSAVELGVISKGRIYTVLERMERCIYNRSAAVLGQSQEIVEYVQEHTSSHVYLFRNGVDYQRFEAAPVVETAEKNRCRKIIYAGLLGVAQRIKEICESINFTDYGLEFHIFGAGPEREEVIEFLNENPDRGIKYKGVLSLEEVPGVLKQYDGALIPLTRMIFGAVPSKIYEAMAAELPILFSGDGEGARIIQTNNIGWVNKAGDMSGLEANIKIFSKANVKSIKETCKVLARGQYNRSLQIRNLYSFLMENVK